MTCAAIRICRQKTPTKRTYVFELPDIEKLPNWNRVKSTFKRRHKKYFQSPTDGFEPYIKLAPQIVGFYNPRFSAVIKNGGCCLPAYASGTLNNTIATYYLNDEEIQKVIK